VFQTVAVLNVINEHR